MNLPNAGKASYGSGETDLRYRWRAGILGNVQQKYISKFFQLQKIYFKQRGIQSPTRNTQIEIGLGTEKMESKTTKKMHFIWVSMHSAGKSLNEDTIFASPSGDGTAILLGHPIRATWRSSRFQCKGSTFISQLPWVMVRPRELNPRPPALQFEAHYWLS